MTTVDDVIIDAPKVIITHIPERKPKTKPKFQADTPTLVLSIGGSKGHVREEVNANGLFAKVFVAYRWRMIPNCTGRYTCRDHGLVSHLNPMQLLKHYSESSEHSNSSEQVQSCSTHFNFRQNEFTFPNHDRKDPIIVIPFDDTNQTGFISYIKNNKNYNNIKSNNSTCNFQDKDSTSSENEYHYYVHTLNAPSGFQRKLKAIGIIVNEQGEYIQLL